MLLETSLNLLFILYRKMIDRHHELQSLEMQYLPDHDMHALRNKTDQMGTRVEPRALDQHAIQVRPVASCVNISCSNLRDISRKT